MDQCERHRKDYFFDNFAPKNFRVVKDNKTDISDSTNHLKKDCNRPGYKEWLPCIGMAIAAFVFNTSEFAPIALLSDIAKGFSISEAKAGLLITIYAWVVALASLPLILIFARVERRKLMAGLLILFIISHLLSWQSYNYTSLLISRILVACTHAIFWSVAAPMAVQMAPEGHRSTGLGIMATGSSLATILGLPFGRTVGLYLGWRMTFLFIGIAAFVVLIFLMLVLPVLKSENAGSLKSLPKLVKRPALMGIYILTVIMVTAHFTAYTYIEPFMINIADLNENVATIVLLIFGVAGIGGSLLFSRYNEKRSQLLMGVSIVCVSISLSLMYPLGISPYTIFLLCIFWGVTFMVYNLVLQDTVIKVAPDATAVAMSIYSGIYNVGIGSGALIGGRVSTQLGTQYVGLAGCLIGILAISFYFFVLKRYLWKKRKTKFHHPEQL